ncbi:hypothetical protein A0128_08730 [Leptospira tipperaryensis]|uniref:Uncharacterized protein n=1 Tax=Leptospira tipperaryensis TaxID=2564040 RepID=A0A1D7UWI4_9LEPT|nr:hypothetical protein A0128_08730 [Leptospira tipperaryensis]
MGKWVKFVFRILYFANFFLRIRDFIYNLFLVSKSGAIDFLGAPPSLKIKKENQINRFEKRILKTFFISRISGIDGS